MAASYNVQKVVNVTKDSSETNYTAPIVGGVIGGLALIAVSITIAVCCLMKRAKDECLLSIREKSINTPLISKPSVQTLEERIRSDFYKQNKREDATNLCAGENNSDY